LTMSFKIDRYANTYLTSTSKITFKERTGIRVDASPFKVEIKIYRGGVMI